MKEKELAQVLSSIISFLEDEQKVLMFILEISNFINVYKDGEKIFLTYSNLSDILVKVLKKKKFR